MRIDFQAIKTIAVSNVVNPDEEYFYRFICRWFSKTFATPLMEVYSLDPHTVLLHYFESRMEGMDEEELDLEIRRTVDPSFDENEEESLQEFIKQVEEEAEAKGKPKDKKGKESVALPKSVERKFDLQDNDGEDEDIDSIP